MKYIGEDILSMISSYVKEDLKPERVPQPMLIMGSHGSGKTTILRDFGKKIEKETGVGTVNILDGKKFFKSEDIIRAIEGENYDVILQQGNDAESAGRQIVLIDDLDYYFKRSSNDNQYILRNYLQRESAPQLIGSISEIDSSLYDYKAPFFEGTRIIYVPALEMDIISDLDIKQEEKERILHLMEYLPPVIGSLKTASEIVSQSSGKEKDLEELAMRFSPLYRTKLEELPLNSQKIIDSLARSETPLTISQLSEQTGLKSGILSTYLRHLVKSGVIEKTMEYKRGSPYTIKDKLFKSWLSMP